MGRFILFILAWGVAPAAEACPWCREAVRAAVATPEALPTAALLALPLVVVALVGAALHRSTRL
jgi:hypothetical protein